MIGYILVILFWACLVSFFVLVNIRLNLSFSALSILFKRILCGLFVFGIAQIFLDISFSLLDFIVRIVFSFFFFVVLVTIYNRSFFCSRCGTVVLLGLGKLSDKCLICQSELEKL